MALSMTATGLTGGNFGSEFDDYEEGSWTPTHATVTMSTTYGYYNKIGRQVICPCHLVFSNAAATATFGGLPFTSQNTTIDNIGPAMTSNVDFSGSGRTWCQTVVYQNNTTWAIYSSGDANGVTSTQTTVNGQWSRMTCIYHT